MSKLHKIRFNVRPTGHPMKEENRIRVMLEKAGEETRRVIGNNQTFIIPKDDKKKEIPEIICNVRSTGHPPEEEDKIREMLEKAADEARRMIC